MRGDFHDVYGSEGGQNLLADRGDLQRGEWLAVHGCGGVGLSAIMLATAIGARIVAVDISKAALAKAEDLGADLLVDVLARTMLGPRSAT